VLLVVLDGFGLNPSRAFIGWAQARAPHLDHYFSTWPHTVLQTSGEAVGLSDDQFGNSEVGHLTLGAGRVLEQDLLRIERAIESRELESHPHPHPAWQAILGDTKRLHLIGLVSDGGVHSHIDHLLGLLPLIVQTGIEPVVHMVTADHGNCDDMVDPQTGEPHTRHTAYPVPCLLAGQNGLHLGTGCSLADVAPTVLELLNLAQPTAMTGRSLLLNQFPTMR